MRILDIVPSPSTRRAAQAVACHPPLLEWEETAIAQAIEAETAVADLVFALNLQLAENGHTHSCNALRERHGQPAVECHGKCFLVKEALAKNRLGSAWEETDPCEN